MTAVVIRRELCPADRAPLVDLLSETNFFNQEELAVALELIDDRLTHGQASHYRFLIAEGSGRVTGYACWGPIPGTQESADLYWIAVHPRWQGSGVGRRLLEAAETWMLEQNRRQCWIETATRPLYGATRAFYFACGYQLAAVLPDYYAPGDGKAIFFKLLGAKAGKEPNPAAKV